MWAADRGAARFGHGSPGGDAELGDPTVMLTLFHDSQEVPAGRIHKSQVQVLLEAE